MRAHTLAHVHTGIRITHTYTRPHVHTDTVTRARVHTHSTVLLLDRLHTSICFQYFVTVFQNSLFPSFAPAFQFVHLEPSERGVQSSARSSASQHKEGLEPCPTASMSVWQRPKAKGILV